MLDQPLLRPKFRLSAAMAALPLLLAACSSSPADSAASPEAQAETQEQAHEDTGTIGCAVGGSAQVRDVCTLERTRADGRVLLVVHHPDGAFRRFDVSADGKSISATDGAEPAQAQPAGDSVDVTVGADRYLIPAKALHDAGQ